MRSDKIHDADDWRSVLESVVVRYRDTVKRRFFRSNAAFALPDLYEFLESESYKYAIHPKSNAVLQGHIAHLLKPGPAPAEPCVAVPRRLQLPGRIVEQEALGGRQKIPWPGDSG